MADGSAALERFIEQALAAGQSRQAITGALLAAGWDRRQVEDVLARWAEVDFPLPVPRPRASLSAREAFEYLVLFTTLHLSAWHLGHLWFAMVNQLFPDPVGFGARLDSSSARWSVATLLICWPVFTWLSSRIARATERQPIKRLSPVRRWLTYLTLFITAAVLIGDLTALVQHVLAGELGIRFLLKVLAVGVIAGTGFGWYLYDLRREETA